MVQGYYQLGGFHPQIEWFRHDEKGLAQMLAGDGSPLRIDKAPVQLVLGIKRSGTSHLLLTESQTWKVVRSMRQRAPTVPPTPSTSFESLSPIEFWDYQELAKKLGTLKPKSHKGRQPVDNSQINKQYDSGGEEGIHRAAFEHGRLLYHVMHGAMDFRNYGLNDASWTKSIRVCSFVFNSYSIDERASEQRLANPMIIDIGLATGDVPDLDQMERTVHLALHRNRHLQGTRSAFKHGATEILDDSSIGSRLQAFFKYDIHGHPIILLVHGEEISRNIFRNLGLDISAWQSGLKHLLGFDTPQVKNEASAYRTNDPRRRPSQPESKNDSRSSHNPSSSFRGDYNQRQYQSRSRSRSPSRPRISNESWTSASSSRYDHPRRSPPRSQDSYGGTRHDQHDHVGVRRPEAFAPVYVVDVRQLYRKLMQTDVGAESVVVMSRRLGLTNDQGCCAGNEAVMLIEIWRSMISGSSIDDQRTFRTILPVPYKSASVDVKVSAEDPPEQDSDEERDPNDIMQNPIPSFGNDPDSDDYGSSDSEY